MTLQEAITGMKIKSWEMRLNDKGRKVVYVRFSEKAPDVSVEIKEDAN